MWKCYKGCFWTVQRGKILWKYYVCLYICHLGPKVLGPFGLRLLRSRDFPFKWIIFTFTSQVGESSLQSGNLYSPFMKMCRNLYLGGNQSDLGHTFRGSIGGIVLWDYERSHEDLLKPLPETDQREPLLAVWSDFTKVCCVVLEEIQWPLICTMMFLSTNVLLNTTGLIQMAWAHQSKWYMEINLTLSFNVFHFEVEDQWTPNKAGLHPNIITIPVPEQEVVSPFIPPPCGLTACDNIDIITAYNDNWQLRRHKRIRYRIVNLSNDNGGNPTVSEAQIKLQHQALTKAFRPYNITLDLTVHAVKNSRFRQRFILSNCRIAKIGNRQCDPECDHPRTGHDGGDCLRLGPCYNWKRQDRVCNMECNTIHYDYDDGDCCNPEVTDVLKTCFDPESPDRWGQPIELTSVIWASLPLRPNAQFRCFA